MTTELRVSDLEIRRLIVRYLKKSGTVFGDLNPNAIIFELTTKPSKDPRISYINKETVAEISARVVIKKEEMKNERA